MEITVSENSTLSSTQLTNTNININAGKQLTLQSTGISADSTLNGATGAQLMLIDSKINASLAAGSVGASGNTAVTTDAQSSDIDAIFSLTHIDVQEVTISGSLTLNVQLTEAELTQFETYLASGIIGFELEGISASEWQAWYGDVSINVTNGTNTLLYTGNALGSTVSTGGNIVLYIPEPSTATLSLLALAGLLARRRRKAV